ncbi:unnamed protein product [Sphagnum balticum]
MPVNRHGPCPFYIKYITQYVLIPANNPPPPGLRDYLDADAMWVDVPNYQRGIAWTSEEVEDLLESRSVLLGNVVLGKFPRPAPRFPDLPTDIHNYAVLVDGLQRFSIGNRIVGNSFPEVLSTSPAKPQVAALFHRLAIKTKDIDVIFLHNDRELANHPRRAIAEAYGSFRQKLKLNLLDKLGDPTRAAEFAQQTTRLFLDRQIAVDLYSDFANPIELTYTFIGMNTIRVDLTPVDLVRSMIVEKAFSSQWTPAEVEALENRFTSVFAEDDKPVSHLLPFVAILKQTLEDDVNASRVFPSWATQLKETEISRFLDYVEAFESCVENRYMQEIEACGDIPYAGLLAFHYPAFLATGQLPAFLNETEVDNSGLRMFLRASLRALLDGRIARTRTFALRALLGEYADLTAYADAISQSYLGRSITQEVSDEWLRAGLRRADKNRSKRIFNAMRLPLDSASAFKPDVYGTKASEYHIDHLIPQRSIEPHKPGSGESETLVNFGPLPAKYNVKAKMTPCAEKLGNNGIYSNWLENETTPHPYAHWLITNQGNLGSLLDLQERLEPNKTPDIVGQRLNWMVQHLLPRI